jgi:FtsH-binding integral membrane protein
VGYTAPLDMTPVINADEDTRSAFLVRVYQHLGLAVAGFIVFETLLFMTGLAEAIYNFISRRGGMAWLLILGGFMVVNMITSKAAHNLENPAAQYAGLFGLAAAEAVIFAPMLHYVFATDGAGTVAAAAFVSGIGFAGLSVVGLTTKSDLTWMRPMIMWGAMMALVAIAAALLFGFHLGVWFSVAMVALAGGSILYQTQSIIRRYPAWAYVGAAVGLFGSLMMMFWYILRIFSGRD